MVPPLDDGGFLSPEAELHALVTAFPDVGFILDADGQYVQVLSNPDTESLLYDDPAALLGSHIEDVFDPEMAETFLRNIEAALESGTLQRFEYSLDVADGERYFEARVVPVADGGDPNHVVYLARDVTERAHRQRQLARQRDYMQAMLDSLDDVFYALDREGTLVDWNRTVESVTGYGPDELSTCTLHEIFGADAAERLAAFVADVFDRGSARRVTEVRTRSGTTIPYEFVASLFEDPAGEDLVVGIGRDVTERVEREQQAQVFGRVLRHNMRNKMTVVDGTADYLGQRDGGGRPTAEIERIRAAARDLLRLTEKAHDATEILLEENRPTQVDIAETAREVLADHRSRYPNAAFTYRGPDSLAVEAIAPIRLAVAELVENAVEHSSTSPPSHAQEDAVEHSSTSPRSSSTREDAGRASSSEPSVADAPEDAVEHSSTNPPSQAQGDEPPNVTVTVERRDGTAVVAVSDDGPGLPEHEANIITREREVSSVFHASGIGLWLVRWIVKRSRGDIRLVSNATGNGRQGRGTRESGDGRTASGGGTGMAHVENAVDVPRLGGTTIVVELSAESPN